MSKYKDFFIDWNAFWAGCGEMTPGGYIQPTPECLHKMFFRKPGLPILMVRMPDGTEKPYWNTFYQQVDYPCLMRGSWCPNWGCSTDLPVS